MEKDFWKPLYYTNRELSWIQFNERILEEARDKENPLFERMKFLSITSSNLDEFFMVRVASLKDMIHAEYSKKDIAGMTAQEQLLAVNEKTHKFVEEQYHIYNKMLLPGLAEKNLHIITSHEELNEAQTRFVDGFFEDNVYPVVTPMAVDSSRPFPLIRNKTLNIGALLSKKGREGELEFATVQVPAVIPRIVPLPDGEDGSKNVILLEQVIERN